MPTLVFLIDVDNTLIANDDVKEIFASHLQVELGPTLTARFWDIYEKVREETGVVNIPLSLQTLREQTPHSEMDHLTFAHVQSIFDNFPYFQYLYPHVLETLAYLRTVGLPVIVSDGDMFFQAEKIFISNLANAVEGRVMIYIHKQEHLDEVMATYPADHYVMIDDKPDILADSKVLLGNRLTTVMVQQGKYATQKFDNFTPDISVFHFGDLRSLQAEHFFSTTA